MGDRVKQGIELRISCSDIMLNYKLSQKFKLLENGEFNYLTISLTKLNIVKVKLWLGGMISNIVKFTCVELLLII